MAQQIDILPRVTNIQETDGGKSATFTVENADPSIVNAIRRTILSDTPLVGFRTEPYEKNDCNITKNTTRFTNEILKQRLSCVPVHIRVGADMPDLENLRMVLSVKNESETMKYITSEDFQIKNVATDVFLSTEEVRKVFPPSPITDDYILFARLRPRATQTVPGESIELSAKMMVTTPSESSCFVPVSTCSYAYTVDTDKREQVWEAIEKRMKADGHDDDEIEYEKGNWMVHDGKRVYIDGSYDFKIDSCSVYNATELVGIACDVIISKIVETQRNLTSSTQPMIRKSTNVMDAYDVILENEDYTLGKALEYVLYKNYYMGASTIQFCGFIKEHPHDTHSIVRISPKDHSKDENYIMEICIQSLEQLRTMFSELKGFM